MKRTSNWLLGNIDSFLARYVYKDKERMIKDMNALLDRKDVKKLDRVPSVRKWKE